MNVRINACIDDLLRDIEEASPLQRAVILARAQLTRMEVFDDQDVTSMILADPTRFGRDELIKVYVQLEDVRKFGQRQQRQSEKVYRKFGRDFPESAREEANTSEQGFEVWMATIGAAIAPGRQEAVNQIWRMLHGARVHFDEAVDSLIEIERRTAGATDSNYHRAFERADRTQWRAACELVPMSFTLQS